jgi:hypothetical protein
MSFYRIDLHMHTNCSDGHNSTQTMVDACAQLNYCAAVITDHDWVPGSYAAGTRVIEALQNNNLLSLPVIHGCEISTPIGDCLLFGSRAIKRYLCDIADLTHGWLKMDKLSLDVWIRIYEQLQSSYQCALVLCHPHQFCNDLQCVTVPITEQVIHFLELLDGIEVRNGIDDFIGPGGIDHLFSYMRPNIRKLCNSDAHTIDTLGACCNFVSHLITDESLLIRWLHNSL